MARGVDARARAARAALEAQLVTHAGVRLIDLGLEAGSRAPGGRVVLRVHLAPGTDRRALRLPEQVDGIPVRVIAGDYRPE